MLVNSAVLFSLALGAITVGANPAPEPPAITAAPKVGDLEKRATTCTFSGSNGASSASKSKTSCSTIILSSVAVPSGTTLDLTDLNEGTHVIFEGETTFGYEEWSGPLVSVSGTDITVTGASGAYLNGDGSRWWDDEGSNGGKTKPKFFYAHDLTDSVISGIYIQNSPVQVFSVDNSNYLTLEDITIDNTDGDDDGAANTDGFDIGDSTYITITGANVYNQDDCVAINSGENIYFSGGVCSGGHGLSIGSVGGRSDNTVKNVTFYNSEIKNSQNGVRIKTIYGDTGSVSEVTYKEITLSEITEYGIIVEQNYDDTSEAATTGVPITDFVLDDVQGTVESTGTDIYIVCGSGSCSDWTWTDVSVSGGKTSSSCTNVPSGISC
ncbi:polygalacturonase E precursor pgaE [Aspergillus japonicus CBS 114.51]|uniref:endo-polygalacturonase n=2 Tax=Aspergillus TaxID=5052 RepID=A0A2V5H3S0_ASPV1|nr:polygalacturonase E precursor pgaE [Aspergillus japonicus CBS 114.51]PYI18221.1 polygalacturonase E precursor pgaE [Aspergillus violaceofuscus CBS 115571]RAH81407.1 polygalacturonase E precursor pgaE [Aspergillus japonicus CBS 114.51]